MLRTNDLAIPVLRKLKTKILFSSFPHKKKGHFWGSPISQAALGPSHPQSYFETHDVLVHRRSLQQKQLEVVQGECTNVTQYRRPLSRQYCFDLSWRKLFSEKLHTVTGQHSVFLLERIWLALVGTIPRGNSKVQQLQSETRKLCHY